MTLQDAIAYDEQHDPAEYSAHTIWAEAYGLKSALRDADPRALSSIKAELREAVNMILAAIEVAQ